MSSALSGQEHYEAAEARLDEVELALADNDPATANRLILEAIAHGLLAVATASAWPGRSGGGS